MVNFVTFLTACLLCSSTAESINGFVRHERGPQGKWVSLENGNQVLVADESHQTQNLSPEKQAALDEIRSRFLDEQATATPSSSFWDKTKEFTKNSWDKTKETLSQIKTSGSMEQPRMDIVDSSETFYNEYAQAWRLMGFYIDCNADQDDHRRELEGEDDEEEGACMRYLLWAAVSVEIVLCFRKKSFRIVYSLTNTMFPLLRSMLILTTVDMVLESTRFGTMNKIIGMDPLVEKQVDRVASTWTVIFQKLTFLSLDILRNQTTENGWNNFSSTKASVLGTSGTMKRPTTPCKV